METLNAMQTRISTRDFSNRPVPRELVEKVVEGALYAPVGLKKYPELRLSVVENKALLQQIDADCRRVPDVSPLHGAPVLLIVSSSTPDEALAHQNAACLVDHMLLRATDLGLANLYVKGICPFLDKNDALKEALRIPAGFRPLASAAVGYPKTPVQKREVPQNNDTAVEYLR